VETLINKKKRRLELKKRNPKEEEKVR